MIADRDNPYAQLRSDIWRVLDEYRGKPIDFHLVRHAVERSGHEFDWQAALVVGELLSRHGEFSLAPHVVEFVAHYVAARHPTRLLDPWVQVPALLVAASQEQSVEEALGYILSEQVAEIATGIEGSEKVVWSRGDALRSGSPPGSFELVVCAPPINARLDGIPGLADLALLGAAGKLLSLGGEMIFLLGENFNFDKRAKEATQALAELSVHQVATVSVADAISGVAIPLQLVIFRHGEPAPANFVARLTGQMDSGQVAEAVLESQESATVELGRFVPHGTYTGWASFAASEELRRALSESPHATLRLADVATSIRRVQMEAEDGDFEAAANAIYLTEIRGVPSLAPTAEGAKRRSYVEVCLDPERATASYLAAWLDSSVGRLARESVATGSTIPRISASAAAEMPVLLPSLEAQLAAIRAESRLTAMTVRAAELRTELWADPGAAAEIESRLVASDERGGLEDWIETLPFPLASIAYRYVADDRLEAKIERLLHLFEATSEFGASLLLSAVKGDASLYEGEREALARPDPDGNPPLERGTFGAWLHIGRRLGKTLRTMLGGEEGRARALRLFGVRDPRLAELLASKRFWAVLDEARAVRNARAHGGIEGLPLRTRKLERLEGLLLELRETIGTAFVEVDLVQPGGMEFRQGVFHHRARRLMGPNPIFRFRELDSVVPLDAEHLYIVDASGVAAAALQILPFFRIMSSPDTEQNAIYFYNSRGRDGLLHYISYHFEAQPESAVDDPLMASVLDELRPRSGRSV